RRVTALTQVQCTVLGVRRRALAVPAVMFVPFMVLGRLMVVALVYMAMRRAAVMAAAVPVAAMIPGLFGQNVAQQAARGRAPKGVKRVALRNDRARRSTQARAYQRIVGFTVAGRRTAGHGESEQAYDGQASEIGRLFHRATPFPLNDGSSV